MEGCVRAGPDLSQAREPPEAPAGGLSLVPPSCQSRTYLGMSTLRDLIFKRPSRQFQYLHVLLDLSSHEKDKVTPRSPSCPEDRPRSAPDPGGALHSSCWVVAFPRVMA